LIGVTSESAETTF
jgi:hypothetical protein